MVVGQKIALGSIHAGQIVIVHVAEDTITIDLGGEDIRAASFATAVSVTGAALRASAGPTPNYPLSAATWNLAPWVPAAMFRV